jgi:hypothetical protein
MEDAEAQLTGGEGRRRPAIDIPESGAAPSAPSQPRPPHIREQVVAMIDAISDMSDAADTGVTPPQAGKAQGAGDNSAVVPHAATRPHASLTLFAENMSGLRPSLALAAEDQTFGALGGSRHVELQAKPCVFGSDCSAIFFDEVHDSVVTVQPSATRKPGLSLRTFSFLFASRNPYSLQETPYPQSQYPAMKYCENFLMPNLRCPSP